MKRSNRNILLLVVLLAFCAMSARAQNNGSRRVNPEDREVDLNTPTLVPMVKVGKVLHDGDSIQYVELNTLYVYPQPVFTDERQRQAYNRLVANIKKVLPIAKEVNSIIIETYEFLQTLPNKKAKDEHM